MFNARFLRRPIASITFPFTPALSLGEIIPRRDSRFESLNRPLSGLRHPLPLRGGEGKGEGAVSIASRFRGRVG
jgi:hypothetical protein